MRIIIFLVINFAGLGLGAIYTATGSQSWYASLNHAPWTPPGWVFGAAWTSIMICFAIYMAFAYASSKNKPLLLTLFGIQWVLNFAWNPLFFKFHVVLFALFVISTLSVLIGYFLFRGYPKMGWKTLLVLPYFIWMLIATSLNAYIYLYN